MAKSNICYHNLRLNIDNEQHCRVHKILAGLNTKVHKSVNQFIVDAVDFYVSCLNDDSFVKETEKPKEDAGYITRDDLGGIREELKSEVKSEIILLLGAALGAGAIRAEETVGRKQTDAASVETAGHAKEAEDLTMMELVDSWG